MHWCYVSARNRDAACTSRSDARTMQSQSRTLLLRRHVRGRGWRPCSLIFAAAKRPKNHLTTGSRSLSTTSTNLSSC